MTRSKHALLAVGVAFGFAVEWISYDSRLGVVLTSADFTVGCVLIGCGVTAWTRRSESRIGPLLALAAFAWFLGTLAPGAAFLHRGPLVHVVLSYPSGRLRTATARVVVAAAYVDGTIEALARKDRLTLVLLALIALAAATEFRSSSGPERTARRLAVAATLALVAVVALGAVGRLGNWDYRHAVLWSYDLVIASIAVVFLFDLLRGRWAEDTVRELMIDLGSTSGETALRDKLARALGDPSLVVGYWLPELDAFVDDAGRPVDLPRSASGKAATKIEDQSTEIAVIIHDQGVLGDRRLLESVAAVARTAVANARLQAEERAQAAELEDSRRRIVGAVDKQRSRLEQELRTGPERLLEQVSTRLAGAAEAAIPPDAAAIAALGRELAKARHELHEFAQGVHPAALSEGGLPAALTLLARRSPVPVRLDIEAERLPEPIEAAFYYACAESLTNAVKHAQAAAVTIEVTAKDGVAAAVVRDDGCGAATLGGGGSGLRGLADRLEALGGRLLVDSRPGAGTSVRAEIPLSG